MSEIKKKLRYRLSIDGTEIEGTIELNLSNTENLNEKQREEFKELQKEYLKQSLYNYVLNNMKLEYIEENNTNK